MLREGGTIRQTRRNDVLKLVAMITMLIDHIGVVLLPQYRILRTIGRIAFPIFAFQLAIGYEKTSSKKRYFNRLLLFGAISQIPYFFLNEELSFEPFGFNVILYFAYAVGILALLDKAILSFKSNEKSKNLSSILWMILVVIGVLLPDVISIVEPRFWLSYGTYGLLLIILFYIIKDDMGFIIYGYILITLVTTYMTGVKYYFYYTDVSYWVAFTSVSDIIQNIIGYNGGILLLDGYFFQARSVMSLVFIYYLTKPEFSFRLNKYVSYLFYPVHITIILLLHLLIY